jgi:choline dehydrogenase-like flavoprotein
MLATPPPTRPKTFSESERRALATIARACMPGGEIFPAAGPAAVDKVDHFFAAAPTFVARGYRALVWALEAASWVHYARPLSRLDDAAILALLERWRTGDYARRMMARMLTVPLKMAHYNDAAMYDHVGCKFGALPLVQIERPRYMTERVLAAADLSPDESFECDVVVIGTGAGGAVAAKELAEAGVAVLILEEGAYHHRDEFTGHAADMQRKLYRDFGATIAFGNVSIPIPIGKSVGGTTTINSGTCYRAPDRVFDHWRAEHGLRDLTPDAMAPFYERVEAVMEVTETGARIAGGVARVIARGSDALGFKHRPLRRNAPECDGQGVCCFGCPTDAKRSTNVSYVPLALKAGAQLVTGVRAERVLVENGRAVGVVARAGERTVTVRARAVVVACGSLLTPVFLQRNGLADGSGQLGKHLSIHPAVGVLAEFDEVIDAANAVPQGYAIEEFHDEGLLFEGAWAPLEIIAAQSTLLGPRLLDMLERYKHMAGFGFMLEDTSRGRVRPGPGGRPLITYWMNDNDVARLKRGVEILARVFLAAGARHVLPQVHGFDFIDGERELAAFRRTRVTPRDFDITAYHPLGTARMGADPRASVVSPEHQVHDVPGLYVMDGSVLPSSPAVNPQLTIMALATRAAQKLAARLS